MRHVRRPGRQVGLVRLSKWIPLGDQCGRQRRAIQTPKLLTGDDQACETGMDRQARHLAAGVGDISRIIDCPQTSQQRVGAGHLFDAGWFEPRETEDIGLTPASQLQNRSR
jgi:hypothetical protein